jgi:phage terminase small subunit
LPNRWGIGETCGQQAAPTTPLRPRARKPEQDMARGERTKKSTATNAVNTFQTVGTVLRPTHDLTPAEMTHFERVTTSREVSTWMPHDLAIATQLARNLARFDRLQEQLDDDGLMQINERGTKVAHPLLSASMTMASTIQALTRTLGLGASQRGIAGAKQASRNSADQEAREIISRASQDDLIG